MTEKSKIILKKPEKAKFFVWELIEGIDLEPKFFRETKKIQRPNEIIKSVE
jgi:hypothetical protein